MAIIEVTHVTKQFRTHRGRQLFLGRGGPLARLFGGRRHYFNAIDDVSFSVEPGESIGVIGANGSGKSTLLKMIGGVTAPTTGEIRVFGRVASLLELGAGFHPFLTGRENVYLNGTILGMSRAQIDRHFAEIVDFAGLESFIDNPVDTYSSGMYVRLGFSVAVHSNPDVFLVDEVLAVGDEAFQRKCRERIGELRRDGKTIVFVSHDLNIVNTLCNRVLLLSQGRMIAKRTPRETVSYYLRLVGQERGVHTMRQGDIEVIAANGRMSLYHRERELTTTSGIELSLISMGNWHNASFADWNVIERDERHCRASGRMARLPLSFIWDLTIDNGVIVFRVELECEQDLEVTQIEINSLLVPGYTRWIYADLSGDFPELAPTDIAPTHVVTSESGVDSAAVFPAADNEDSLPPLVLTIRAAAFHTKLVLANTDFIAGSRLLQASVRIPESAQPLKAGRYELATLELDFSRTEQTIRDTLFGSYTVVAGPLSARFMQGRIELRHNGELVTKLMHVWSSVLKGNLWNNSDSLRWSGVTRDGAALVFTGESRRAPFQERWRISPDGDSIRLQIWIRPLERLELQEYHVSIMAPDTYTEWERGTERGIYPPFAEGEEDWVHLNRDYSPTAHGSMRGEGVPTIGLTIEGGAGDFHLTALNTGKSQGSRVLQALWVSKNGSLILDHKEHLVFDGRVSAGAPAVET